MSKDQTKLIPISCVWHTKTNKIPRTPNKIMSPIPDRTTYKVPTYFAHMVMPTHLTRNIPLT